MMTELRNTIICGDCLDVMREMPDRCVDLVVTSPPYNAAKDYGNCADSWDAEDYFAWNVEWIKAVCRILKKGHVLCLNLPWCFGSRPRTFVPHRLATMIENETSLRLTDWVTWVKGYPPHVTNATAWGTYLSPSGPRMRLGSEPVLLFTKEARGRGDPRQNDISKEEWNAWAINVWHISGAYNRNHPATFPQELPRRLIKLLTHPGEIVLDPFIGSGTTAVAAKELGRDYLGIEINPKYVERANQRLRQLRLL